MRKTDSEEGERSTKLREIWVHERSRGQMENMKRREEVRYNAYSVFEEKIKRTEEVYNASSVFEKKKRREEVRCSMLPWCWKKRREDRR